MKSERVSRRQLFVRSGRGGGILAVAALCIGQQLYFMLLLLLFFFNRLKAKSVCQSEANTAQKNSATGFKCVVAVFSEWKKKQDFDMLLCIQKRMSV